MNHERDKPNPDRSVLGEESSPDHLPGLTRRTMLGRVAGGAALLSGGALLAACGSSSQTV